MFEVQITNTRNETLILTGDQTKYQVIDIDGLNPPKAQINMFSIAGLDGSKFNSSKLETRNIVITVKINGGVENNRQYLYTFFQTKEWCKFRFTNTNRDVFIDCYVESVECDLFTNSEKMQISLICPQPYFRDAQEIIDNISNVLSAFVFPFAFGSKGATNPDVPIDNATDNAIPFSIIELNKITNVYNNSDSSTGVIVQIAILGSVNTIQIQNTETGESIVLKGSFVSGDTITINTNKGEKSVSLLRNGQTSNLFTSIQKGSVFFQLAIGDNFFSYTVDGGAGDTDVNIIFQHYTLYRGV